MQDPGKPGDLLFTVDPHWGGMRLDHYLKAMLPSMSRSKIQRRAKAGHVFVNDSTRPANWKVQTGDAVRFVIDDAGEDREAGKLIPLDVLHEDEDIIAIHKAAGLHVHPVTGHRFDTIMNALYWRFENDTDIDLSLAHRLDKVTSGVLLAAKHQAARDHLQKQFEERTPKKTYVALACGHLESDEGEIDLPLATADNPRAREKTVVAPDGKASLTRYRVLERLEGGPGVGAISHVQLHPATGRQHQLRVHLKAIGHPLCCDDRYGEAAALQVGDTRLDRCALHAAALTFKHPRRDEEMTLKAPLPRDLDAFLEALRSPGR